MNRMLYGTGLKQWIHKYVNDINEYYWGENIKVKEISQGVKSIMYLISMFGSRRILNLSKESLPKLYKCVTTMLYSWN